MHSEHLSNVSVVAIIVGFISLTFALWGVESYINEGRRVVGCPAPVDQLDALCLQPFQRGLQIVHPVREMMEARAAPFQEPGDGRVRGGRRDQLDAAGARTDEADFDLLRFHALRRGTISAQKGFE